MAADRIVVNRNVVGGAMFIQFAETIFQLMGMATKLSGIVGHGNDGTTYTQVEASLGLQAGAGANAASLIAGLNDVFNTNTTIAGQTRLDRFNEIVGRVAGQ